MIRTLTIGLATTLGWAISPSPAYEPGREQRGTPPRAESREADGPRTTVAPGELPPAKPDFKAIDFRKAAKDVSAQKPPQPPEEQKHTDQKPADHTSVDHQASHKPARHHKHHGSHVDIKG